MNDHTTIPPNYKRCTKCSEVKPIEQFNKDAHKASGRRSHCKTCTRKFSQQWREENPGYIQKYRKENPEYDQGWRERNRDKLRKYSKKWREENREKICGYSQKYHEKNRDKERETNRKWREENREKIHEYASKRRARERTAKGTHTASDIRLIYERQGRRCWWCQCKLGREYHVDHRIPLTKGGSNDPSNLVISCSACNLSKGAKLPHEWNGRLL